MLSVKIQSWDGAEEVVECERVLALKPTLCRAPGDSNDSHWYEQRTVICYFDGETSTTFSTCDGFLEDDPTDRKKQNSIYVMNDKGRTITIY